jgi:hypothetical protein
MFALQKDCKRDLHTKSPSLRKGRCYSNLPFLLSLVASLNAVEVFTTHTKGHAMNIAK